MSRPKTIKVTVYSARNIRAKKGNGDPLAWVVFGFGKQKCCTAQIRDRNAKWNEESTFTVTDPRFPLKMTIKDKDDPVGNIVIPMSELPSEEHFLKWVPIGPHRKFPNPTGELCLDCWIEEYYDESDNFQRLNEHGGQKQQKPRNLTRLKNKLVNLSPNLLSGDNRKAQGPGSSAKGSVSCEDLTHRSLHKPKNVLQGENSFDKFVNQKNNHLHPSPNANNNSNSSVDRSPQSQQASPARSRNHNSDSSSINEEQDDETDSPHTTPNSDFSRTQTMGSANNNNNNNRGGPAPSGFGMRKAVSTLALTSNERRMMQSSDHEYNLRGNSPPGGLGGPGGLSVIKEQTNYPPKVMGIVPNQGASSGGTLIQITGRNLGLAADDITRLMVAGCNCLSTLEYYTPNKIMCTTLESEGIGPISITTKSGGTSSSKLMFEFISPKKEDSREDDDSGRGSVSGEADREKDLLIEELKMQLEASDKRNNDLREYIDKLIVYLMDKYPEALEAHKLYTTR